MSVSNAHSRRRVARLARYAGAVGGLGIGWLLLSAGAASANESHDITPGTSPVAQQVNGDSDLNLRLLGAVKVPSISIPTLNLAGTPSQPPIAGTPTASAASTAGRPVLALVQTTTSAVTTTLRAVPITVEQVQSTTSSILSTTTASAGDVIRSVPLITEPVLAGPLAPIAPLVSDVTSSLGGTVDSVGGTLGSTVSSLPVSSLTRPVVAITEPVIGVVDTVTQPLAGVVDVLTPPLTGVVIDVVSPAVGAPAIPSVSENQISKVPSYVSPAALAVPVVQESSPAVDLASVAKVERNVGGTDGNISSRNAFGSLPHAGAFGAVPSIDVQGATEAGTGSAKPTNPAPQPVHELGGMSSTSPVLRGGNDSPAGMATTLISADGDSAAALSTSLQNTNLLVSPVLDPGSTPD